MLVTVTVKRLLVWVGLRLLNSVVFGQRPSVDLVLFNGKVFTSNSNQPYAEALAIRGERIVAVGSSKEIIALAGKKTRRLDLGGGALSFRALTIPMFTWQSILKAIICRSRATTPIGGRSRMPSRPPWLRFRKEPGFREHSEKRSSTILKRRERGWMR
jgi:hypothetical protein